MKSSLIGSIRYLLARGAETATSIALVLLFFLSLMALLHWLMPSGPGLGALFAAGRDTRSADASHPGPGDRALRADGMAADAAVAVLAQTHNSVKSKPHDAIAWADARSGMSLENRHAVQTFKRASALISFDEQTEIDVGQNTVIVIQKKDTDLFARGPRSYALTVDGELRGRVAQGGAQPVEFEVTTSAGTAWVKPAEDEPGEVEFRVTVAEDSTAQITVDKGTAEVAVRGDTVKVAAQEFTRLEVAAAPSRPRPLAPAPRIMSPAPGEVFRYRSVAPPVDFRWAGAATADRYRFQIARDEAFGTVLYDDVLTRARHTHHTLKPGVYFWRVTGLRRATPVTAPRSGWFRVQQDRDAPVLEVTFPSGVVKEDACTISGRAEPGTRVLINGQEIPLTERGAFEYRLALSPGLNVVVVEAIDVAGNTAYRSEMVNRKF